MTLKLALGCCPTDGLLASQFTLQITPDKSAYLPIFNKLHDQALTLNPVYKNSKLACSNLSKYLVVTVY